MRPPHSDLDDASVPTIPPSVVHDSIAEDCAIEERRSDSSSFSDLDEHDYDSDEESSNVGEDMSFTTMKRWKRIFEGSDSISNGSYFNLLPLIRS